MPLRFHSTEDGPLPDHSLAHLLHRAAFVATRLGELADPLIRNYTGSVPNGTAAAEGEPR